MGNLCIGSTEADAEDIEFWTRAQEKQREMIQDRKDTDDTNVRWWKSSFADYTPGVYDEASEAKMRLNKSGIWHMVAPQKPMAVA